MVMELGEKSALEKIEAAKENNIRFVQMQFTDIIGAVKSVTIPLHQLADSIDPRHVVRRQLDRGLHAHRRERPVPQAGHGHLRRDPLAARPWHARRRPAGQPRHGASDLRRLHAQRRAVRGRSALHPQAPARARQEARLHLERRPGARVLPVPTREDGELKPLPHDEAGYFDFSTDLARRSPAGHGQRARGLRHSRRGRPPRGGARPARDRLPVRRRPAHGRQRGDLQVHAEGDRPAARPVRDVHAQADLRHQRLRHAHPPEPVAHRQGSERLRRRRQRSTACRPSPGRTWPASWPTPAA